MTDRSLARLDLFDVVREPLFQLSDSCGNCIVFCFLSGFELAQNDGRFAHVLFGMAAQFGDPPAKVASTGSQLSPAFPVVCQLVGKTDEHIQLAFNTTDLANETANVSTFRLIAHFGYLSKSCAVSA